MVFRYILDKKLTKPQKQVNRSEVTSHRTVNAGSYSLSGHGIMHNLKDWTTVFVHTFLAYNYEQILYGLTSEKKPEELYVINTPQDSGLNLPEGHYSIHELNQAIDSFADEYKVPFKMHILGHSNEDIASKLNLPQAKVRSRIFFINERLEEILKGN